jgi:hypothetical protein
MLGMQDDINDIELKQRWRLYWIYSIFELSNIKLQEVSWITNDTKSLNEKNIWSSSFEESTSAYFDNLSLFDGYDKAIKYGNVTQEEAQNAAGFHTLLYMYDEPSDNPKEILQDEEWLEVTQAVKTFWNYLKNSVTSQREIELVKELEKNYYI